MLGGGGREILVHRHIVAPERQRARRVGVNGCNNCGAGICSRALTWSWPAIPVPTTIIS